jgi:hypothetical protein
MLRDPKASQVMLPVTPQAVHQAVRLLFTDLRLARNRPKHRSAEASLPLWDCAIQTLGSAREHPVPGTRQTPGSGVIFPRSREVVSAIRKRTAT